jgi:hypothetical protein
MEGNNINIEMFFGLSIFSLSFSFFIYRKLKFINASNKNVEKLELQSSVHQFHQIAEKFTMATNTPTARRSNLLVRFITSFAGSSYAGNDKDERRSTTCPSMADAESQVCDDIMTKRERRSRVQRETEGDDQTPREGFIQEMFESSSCCGATQADPKIQETHTCSVCLDELSIGSGNTTTTVCGHTFHLSCLLKSLTQKNTCPMCRGDLEDVRTKQMPTNILTPLSAEQIIEEEISYFTVGSHTHSIVLSRHPKRRAKEMLRVFGFTLLRTVSEYVHDENMPPGWFDDAATESESETEEEEDNSEDDQDADDQDADNSEDDQDDQDDQDNQDEFNYAYASRESRGDLRDSI